MEIKCLIVDDELPAQRILEKYIADVEWLSLEGKCRNALEAMQALHEKKIDVLFLDINMPKMTGLEFLKTLKNKPAVILTTAYREYALEAYELDVLDYLKKPFSFERFLQSVNKLLEKPQTFVLSPSPRQQLDESFLFVKDDKVTYRINFKDILFVESVGDYIKIVSTEKVYLTYQTLKRIEAFLPQNHFPRVHKSFLVSLSKINSIEGNLIHIDQHEIPIGQTFRKTFFELIEQFMAC